MSTSYLSTTGATLFSTEVSYTYNNDGSRATMTAPPGTFTYTTDNAGRLTQVKYPWSASVTYGYWNNNWLSSQSSFQSGIPLVNSSYNYNARGQLTSLSNGSGGTQLSTFQSMTYDGAGNRLGMNVQIPAVVGVTSLAAGVSGNITWTYDGLDHLSGENNMMVSAGGGTNQYAVPYNYSFVSDAAENLTTFRGATLGYNNDNQLNGLTFDGDGNPTTYPVQGSRAVTYDPEDRMTFLTGLIKAGYFADGRRAWKYSTYFLYDGNTLLCELDGSGNVQTTYGYGAAGLVQRNASGVTYGYTFDPAGNLVQRTSTANLANGVVADFTTYYDAFGAQLHQIDVNSGSSFQNPDAVGFGGQWGYYTENVTSPPAAPGQLPVVRTPICLLGARYYDPSVGRFLTRDPAGYEGGINVYSYAGNNPVMDSDPSGLDGLDDLSNFSAGWGDALTFGGTAWIRGKLSVDGVVNRSTGAYLGGYVVGTVHQTVLFNAGAKAIMAARGAQAASTATSAAVNTARTSATAGVAATTGYRVPNVLSYIKILKTYFKLKKAFEAAGGTWSIVEEVGELEGGGEALGLYSSRFNKIFLYYGHDFGTKVHELLHFEQALRYGYLGSTYVEKGLTEKFLEAQVERKLVLLGFVPK